MKTLYVIKIGGGVLDHPSQLNAFLKAFSKLQGSKILVHGGGKIATQLGKKLGIQPKMVKGRRITDQKTIELVQMIYGGLINKNLVASLQQLNCKALGFTGADGDLIRAKKRAVKSIDYGWVGDVTKVNINLFLNLLNGGYVPVIAPLTHDGKGHILNTNADTLASEIAVALCMKYKVDLVYCFEKKGVLRNINKPNSIIGSISVKQYKQLLEKNVIHDGMIPKLDNSFTALRKGVNRVLITHAKQIGNLKKGEAKATVLTR